MEDIREHKCIVARLLVHILLCICTDIYIAVHMYVYTCTFCMHEYYSAYIGNLYSIYNFTTLHCSVDLQQFLSTAAALQ